MRIKNVLVTGASGKIGRNLAPALVAKGYRVRAVQFHTPITYEGVEVIKGSVSDRDFARSALEDMDAVCHLATSKEDRDGFLDVSVRGTFNLLDESRECGHIKQFILASGDASVGIFFYPHPYPIDEQTPLAAYPGYYAFSKVLEETMCAQYIIQYSLPTTILRFSWIQDEMVIPEKFGHGSANSADRMGRMQTSARALSFSEVFRDRADIGWRFARVMDVMGILLVAQGRYKQRSIIANSPKQSPNHSL